ncbi:MAG: hypothetical protein DRI36_02600 [Caldiserica bacterium]|nr:MAG: hypothetical protein DRI36_02600 [Caldisericota bacterium]
MKRNILQVQPGTSTIDNISLKYLTNKEKFVLYFLMILNWSKRTAKIQNQYFPIWSNEKMIGGK